MPELSARAISSFKIGEIALGQPFTLLDGKGGDPIKGTLGGICYDLEWCVCTIRDENGNEFSATDSDMTLICRTAPTPSS